MESWPCSRRKRRVVAVPQVAGYIAVLYRIYERHKRPVRVGTRPPYAAGMVSDATTYCHLEIESRGRIN